MDLNQIVCRLLIALALLGVSPQVSAQYDNLFDSPVAEPATNPAVDGPLLPKPVFVSPTQYPITQTPAAQYPTTEYAAPITPIEAVPVEALPPVAADPAAMAPAVEADLLTEGIAEEETVNLTHWYYPTYWFGPTPWDSGFELGLNGSAGTSESLSFRTGGFVKRRGKDFKIDLSLYYNKTNADGKVTQSNALLDARYDWLFDDSQWSLFILSQTFYDEFQAFDLNVNVSTGIGYQWIDRETLKLTTSFGSGASREFGGPNEEWTPEANFGLNFEKKLSATKKFYTKVDYFPEWEDFSRYRILTDIGLEIELSQPSNLSLKFSATDRYDSEPDGVDPHNLNYSALLILKL